MTVLSEKSRSACLLQRYKEAVCKYCRILEVILRSHHVVVTRVRFKQSQSIIAIHFYLRSFICFGLFFFYRPPKRIRSVCCCQVFFNTRSLSFLFLVINVTNIIINAYKIWIKKSEWYWRAGYKSR